MASLRTSLAMLAQFTVIILLTMAPSGATVISPSVEEMAIPLCSQTELVYVGTLLTKNELKKECENVLNIKEMLRVKVDDVQKMCTTPSCLAAFEQLYTTLPTCRYLDWPIKYNFRRLLQHCGVDPNQQSSNSTHTNDAESEDEGDISAQPASPSASSSSPDRVIASSTSSTKMSDDETTPCVLPLT